MQARADDHRYVLALGEDADRVADAPGTTIVRRLPMVVVVETDVRLAIALAHAGEYVHVYRSADEALQALGLFER